MPVINETCVQFYEEMPEEELFNFLHITPIQIEARKQEYKALRDKYKSFSCVTYDSYPYSSKFLRRK